MRMVKLLATTTARLLATPALPLHPLGRMPLLTLPHGLLYDLDLRFSASIICFLLP